MRALLFIALAALSSAGCTLALDPARHMGGGGTDAGIDASMIDAPEMDAPGADVPLIEPDAPDAGMPDTGPPECTNDGECDFASRCSMGRCVLCVDDPAVVQLDADALLGVADFDLLAAGDELAVSWRGDGTRVYLHRTSLTAPAAPPSRTSVTDALTLGFLTGITEVTDIALGADRYDQTNAPIDVAMLGRNGAGTFITAADVRRDGAITSDTYPTPDRVPAGQSHLGRIAISGDAVISRRGTSSAATIEALDTAYLNDIAARRVTFTVPTAPLTSMEASNAFILMAEPTGAEVFTVSQGRSSVDDVDSTGRTGPPDWAQIAARDFMLAYPAGREIFLRTLECVGQCLTSTSGRADFATGSDEVAWVRIAMLDTDYVLLSGERTGTTWRVVLRVLRPDFRPLTAPGGGTAWVLAETNAGTYPIGRLEIGETAGVSFLVPSWIEQPTSGNRALRIASEPVTCP